MIRKDKERKDLKHHNTMQIWKAIAKQLEIAKKMFGWSKIPYRVDNTLRVPKSDRDFWEAALKTLLKTQSLAVKSLFGLLRKVRHESIASLSEKDDY